jgi:hypothetical protein
MSGHRRELRRRRHGVDAFQLRRQRFPADAFKPRRVGDARVEIGDLLRRRAAPPIRLREYALDDRVQIALDLFLQLDRGRIEETSIAKNRSASLPGPKDSSAGTVLSLNDGPRLVRIESNGTVSGLKPLSRADERLVSLVLTTGNLKMPAGMAELRGDSRSFMGSGGDSGQHPLLTPVGVVVESDSPTLRWRPLDGATAYTVGVYDSELNEIAVSEPLRATEWKIPQSLKRGEIYIWQVRASLGSQEIILPAVDLPDAKFKVLERSWLQRLERARRAADDSHLVLGILYARAGLLGEAERELKAAALANPRSLLAERLLNSVKDMKER